MKKRINLRTVVYNILLILVGFVFFFWIGEHGPIFMKDTYSFMDAQSPRGYIIYPLFIKLVRLIVGEEALLEWLFIFQSVLAILSSIFVISWLRKRYSLPKSITFVIYILSFFPYAYSLPEHVLSHELMTESLAVPIFNIFFLFCLDFVSNCSKKNALGMFLCCGVLILIRPQLLTMLAVVLICCFAQGVKMLYRRVAEKRRKQLILEIILFMASIMLLFGVFINNNFRYSSQLTDAVASKVLCLIDTEDREAFKGVELEVFDELFETVDEAQYRRVYFSEGVYRATDIMNAINRNTRIYTDVFNNVCLEYYDGYPIEEIVQLTRQIRINMISNLLWRHWGDFVLLTIQLLPYSFVAAIFIQPDAIKEVCYVITLGLYIMNVALLVWVKKKDVSRKYIKPMYVTCLILLVNVILTNIIFYAMQRYVIYTFGWFYISLIIAGVGIWRKYKYAICNYFF